MIEDLEQVLGRLTQPDNSVIHQATVQLKQAFKDPAVIPALCVIMNNSQNPQIRQSASVMLRMRVRSHWKKISLENRENIKTETLKAFQQETEHQVRHSLSQLCAALVKHETPNRWPVLLSLLNQSTTSSNPEDRRVGLLLLNKVVESNPEAFQPHYFELLRLFSSVLEDLGNPTAIYYTILSLTAITACTGPEHVNSMKSLTPKLIPAIKQLIQTNQNQACEAMEVFDELMESEVNIIVPYINDIIHFWLELAADTSLGDSIRVKALSCITFLIRLKSKTVLKQKLLSPILKMVFPVMSAVPPPGEEDPEDQEEDSDEEDNESPKHSAAQVIDALALHLPPEKLFSQLMPFTEACMTSENPYDRKAGLMCLAVLSEGCADHIRTNMLPSMLQRVCQSLSDSSQVVRSAGLFALGQFSEFLQPEISNYSSELIPLLMGYLSGLNQNNIGHMTKAFYALENFLENLGEKIEPYLPVLMKSMLDALNSSESLKIKELSISSIGAIACAAQELMVPYFHPVIESLKGLLTDMRDEMRSLQTQALDTLSTLARAVGKETFAPLAAECVQLGLKLTDAEDDPDLRRCTYSLFSAISSVSPDCLIPHLPAITTIMVLALKSTEGVTAPQDEEKEFLLLEDDDDDEDGEADVALDEDTETDGEDKDIAGFNVENAYTDEKEDACDALGEIAFNTGSAFTPFLESSFEQVYQMRDFPHENVRRAAFGTMAQFCRAQHKVWQENPTDTNHQALQKLLSVVLSCFLDTVRHDHERNVVMGVLESMNSVIKSCKGEALQAPGRLEEISRVIRDVLKKKTTCQDGTWEEAEDEEQEAEYDAMLLEFAGEGIPLLAAAVPAARFAPFLKELLPLILSKSKSSCTVADRSFCMGTLGEIVQSLTGVVGGADLASSLSGKLLPVLLAGARDSDDEVRSNSVFGLGMLAQATGKKVVPQYPAMLSLFSSLLSKETDQRVIDNLCAALCRMIVSCPEHVPLDQVFPVLVSNLPLKQDVEENKTVFSCLGFLYSHNPAMFVSHLPTIVSASAQVLHMKNIDSESRCAVCLLLQGVAQRYSQEFEAAVQLLPTDEQTFLTSAVTHQAH